MFDYRDFHPDQLEPGGFFKVAKWEPFEAAMKRANEWVEEHEVEVINIETVVLPNIYSPGEEGSEDAKLHTSGEYGSGWYQVLRVWFRT